MHDLLVHGHEGVHRMIARTPLVNEILTWLTHALTGFSGTAYRSFHLDHHKYAHTEKDPEYRMLNAVVAGVPGWAYMAIPLMSHLYVNTYPFRTNAGRVTRRRTVWDLLLMVGLHASIAALIGISNYGLFVLIPIFTSLSAVVVIRSLCEHHGAFSGDRWTNTRTMNTMRVLEILWSNVNYHLEHHLYPFVPFHKLPTVRQLIVETLKTKNSPIGEGYIRTSTKLLVDPNHFGQEETAVVVQMHSLAFRLKVHMFEDVLQHRLARKHLWSLYYAGEAYEELHPQGVYIRKLPAPLDKLLTKHLADEARHATIFKALLEKEGASPEPLPDKEDVGWYLLSHILPDIVEKSGDPAPFKEDELQRYMAFLHALELRSISDLCALMLAAEKLGETSIVEKIQDILRDERFHATYTHRLVVQRATTPQQAQRLLRNTLQAEKTYYTHCLRHILAHFESLGAKPRNWGGRLRWGLMKLAARGGLAAPLLPVYDQMPTRLMKHPLMPQPN